MTSVVRAAALPRSTVSMVVALLAVAALVVVIMRVGGWASTAFSEPPRLQARLGPHDWRSAIQKIDLQMPALEKLSVERSDEWPLSEQVAVLALTRARLTGDYADLERAEAALRRAFAVAPAGTGPHLTAAQLAMATHRLDMAERMLAAIDAYAVPADAGTATEVMAIRGDIAFYRGRTDQARALYKRAEASGGGGSFRLAVLDAASGEPDRADGRYRQLMRAPGAVSSQMLWSINLQRAGIAMQRGDWAQAGALVEQAEQAFAGHWLTAAYRAQMQALDGDLDGAARAYRAVLSRARSPEAMQGLAAVQEARGDAADARRWRAAASQVWEDRLRRLPEASQLHASEHFLDTGDFARALHLARQEVRNRPFGDGLVALANALNAARQPVAALEAVGRAKGLGWRSPDMYIAAMRSFELLGDRRKAMAAREIALELNPREFDRRDALIAFGH